MKAYSFPGVIDKVLGLIQERREVMPLKTIERELSLNLQPYFYDEETLNRGIFYFFKERYRAEKAVFFKDLSDLLFEKTMGYFDSVEPYKEAYGVLYNHYSQPSPESLCVFWRPYLLHVRGILAHAFSFMEAPPSPLIGSAIQIAVMPQFMTLTPIWLRDENPDLGKTMAALQTRIDSISFLWKKA